MIEIDKNITDLYQLIANNEGVDHKKLALLLYDIIHVTFDLFISNQKFVL